MLLLPSSHDSRPHCCFTDTYHGDFPVLLLLISFHHRFCSCSRTAFSTVCAHLLLALLPRLARSLMLALLLSFG